MMNIEDLIKEEATTVIDNLGRHWDIVFVRCSYNWGDPYPDHFRAVPEDRAWLDQESCEKVDGYRYITRDEAEDNGFDYMLELLSA